MPLAQSLVLLFRTLTGQDKQQVVDLRANSRLRFGANREPIIDPAWGEFDCFSLVPATAVAADTDKFFILEGSGASVTKAHPGVRLSTGSTAGNYTVIRGVAGTVSRLRTSVKSAIVLEICVSIGQEFDLFGSAGMTQDETNVLPSLQSGEAALFFYDPSGSQVAATDLTQAQHRNWIVCTKSSLGTSTVYKVTNVPVVPGRSYVLRIVVGGKDMRPKYYIDGALVATGAAMTDSRDHKAFLGIQTITNSARTIDANYFYMGRDIRVVP